MGKVYKVNIIWFIFTSMDLQINVLTVNATKEEHYLGIFL